MCLDSSQYFFVIYIFIKSSNKIEQFYAYHLTIYNNLIVTNYEFQTGRLNNDHTKKKRKKEQVKKIEKGICDCDTFSM